LSVYFDASVLIALFTDDALAARADALLKAGLTTVLVSDFAAVEFASAIARRVRAGEMSTAAAHAALSAFDAWTAQETVRVETRSADFANAAAALRRLDLALRAGDVVNVAIAQRIGADLATFDAQMAAAARTLGITVVAG
jgi:uncharacterized protein